MELDIVVSVLKQELKDHPEKLELEKNTEISLYMRI